MTDLFAVNHDIIQSEVLHAEAYINSAASTFGVDNRLEARTPTVDFHFICTKYKVQIKRARAYPCERLPCSRGGGWGRIPS